MKRFQDGRFGHIYKLPEHEASEHLYALAHAERTS